MKTCILATGGTGGHILPAIAVGEVLKSRGYRVLYTGVGRGVEKKILSKYAKDYFIFDSAPITGKGLKGILKFLCLLPIQIYKIIKFYRKQKPEFVIGFGGYPAFIPLLTAFLLKIPRFIQEQNFKPGLANKIISKVCNKIFSVEDNFQAPIKTDVIPINPVRNEFLNMTSYHLDKSNFHILVMGGSQGAASMNKLVSDSLFKIKDQSEKKISVLHQCGSYNLEEINTKYQNTEGFEAVEFISDVAGELAKAHLVISRAGAMAVSEITASKRPCIYLPLKIANAHQKYNVMKHAETGSAIIATEENFVDILSDLVKNDEILTNMSNNCQKLLSKVDGSVAQFIVDKIEHELK